MKQAVWDEARQGNFAPLGRLLAVCAGVGEAVADVRALVRGSERPTGTVDRLLDNCTTVAGFGLGGDLVQAAARRGVEGAATYLVGPFFSDALQVGVHAGRAVEATAEGDDLRRDRELAWLGRFAARQLPYGGPRLSEQLRTDPAAEARGRKTWEQRLGFDPGERQLRAVESINQRARLAQRYANDLAAAGRLEEAQAYLARFNERFGTAVRLSPEAIRHRRREEADPTGARVRRLAPGVRGLARELDVIPPLPEHDE
jgi:hypothetical protein